MGTMRFWEERRKAEARSKLLLVCFVATAFLGIFAPYFIVHSIVVAVKVSLDTPKGFPGISELAGPIFDGWMFWRYPYFPVVAGVVLVPVLWGAARLFLALRGGGRAVAELMNANRVPLATSDANERRLLNVVEEVSIAAGTPTPETYILSDESGINAATAGFSGNTAAICVTRGAVELLTRDELQGVVAHEFSHIVDGDMALHTFTLGLTHGFFAARGLKRGLDISEGVSGNFSRDAFMLLAQCVSIFVLLPFWLWFYDLIFGGSAKIVKAMFFRKREYLADANAVRLTRYPTGLAGAMKKILALPAIQAIRTRCGDEANHLFFDEPLRTPFAFLVASHPPVDRRIGKLEPGFDGKIDDIDVPELKKEIRGLREDINLDKRAWFSGSAADGGALPGIARGDRASALPDMVEQAFLVAALERAKRARTLAERLDAAVPNAEDAVVYVFALLMDNANSDVRAIQTAALENAYSAETAKKVETTRHALEKIPPETIVTLLERRVSALGTETLDPVGYDRFITTCRTLVLADDKITLMEYAVTAFLRRRLDHRFGLAEPAATPIGAKSLAGYAVETETLLSIMSWAGAKIQSDAERAFDAGLAELPAGTAKRLSLQSLKPFDPEAANRAVAELSALRAKDKETLFQACLAAIGEDDKIEPAEWEIIRLFALMIDCPLPPAPAPWKDDPRAQA